ncbi:helix-turn-helix domain-containing protein [Kangiella sp.]|uniref:helix-turn-helix domain-containing protein n=1 Tax=Kangiella sp. TaxID=1920245 RepID=UPI003A93CA16
MKKLQICDILKELRLNNPNGKLSKEQVSEICDVNPSTYMRWEKGDTKLPFEAVLKLSSFYNVPVAYFSGNYTEEGNVRTSFVDQVREFQEKLADMMPPSNIPGDILEALENADEHDLRSVRNVLGLAIPEAKKKAN